eukprot:scaffold7375_cov268-Pinguiococcus_pyrenoidosus.AAC.31
MLVLRHPRLRGFDSLPAWPRGARGTANSRPSCAADSPASSARRGRTADLACEASPREWTHPGPLPSTRRSPCRRPACCPWRRPRRAC